MLLSKSQKYLNIVRYIYNEVKNYKKIVKHFNRSWSSFSQTIQICNLAQRGCVKKNFYTPLNWEHQNIFEQYSLLLIYKYSLTLLVYGGQSSIKLFTKINLNYQVLPSANVISFAQHDFDWIAELWGEISEARSGNPAGGCYGIARIAQANARGVP